MSETREAYSVTLQPGDELDVLVAKVLGYREISHLTHQTKWRQWWCETPQGKRIPLPYFSYEIVAAMDAWTWLEEHHPWRKKGDTLALMRIDGKPGVCRLMGYDLFETIATGNDYPHAIALAVVEAGKIIGLIDNAPNL